MGSLTPRGFCWGHRGQVGGWEGQGHCFILLRCEHAEKSFGWMPLWVLLPNNDRRGRLSVRKEAVPCLFPESSVFWLVLSLSDLGTPADSLPFPDLELPGLRVQQGMRVSGSSQF